MILISGYPEFILNTTKLDNFYSGLEIKSDEYLMNTIRLKKFSFKKQLSTLDRNIDKSKYILKRIRSSTRYVHIV